LPVDEGEQRPVVVAQQVPEPQQLTMFPFAQHSVPALQHTAKLPDPQHVWPALHAVPPLAQVAAATCWVVKAANAVPLKNTRMSPKSFRRGIGLASVRANSSKKELIYRFSSSRGRQRITTDY